MTAPAFTAPRVPGALAFPEDGSERHAARALEAVRAGNLATAAEWAAVTSDPRLTTEGQRDAITPHAQTLLTEFRKHEAALAEDAKEITEAVERHTVEPELSVSAARRAELLAVADAFGRKPRPEQERLLTEAVADRDPDLALALVLAHPVVTGVGQPVRQLLRDRLQTAAVDPQAKEKLLGRAQRLAATRAALAASIDAVELLADRDKLRAAGVATLRRRDFADDAARAAWIGEHGLTAYKALPA